MKGKNCICLQQRRRIHPILVFDCDSEKISNEWDTKFTYATNLRPESFLNILIILSKCLQVTIVKVFIY